MGFTGFQWVSVCLTGFRWVSLFESGFHSFLSWVSGGCTGLKCFFVTGFNWVLLCFIWFYFSSRGLSWYWFLQVLCELPKGSGNIPRNIPCFSVWVGWNSLSIYFFVENERLAIGSGGRSVYVMLKPSRENPRTHINSVKPSKIQSNPVKPSQTQSNPVKPSQT